MSSPAAVTAIGEPASLAQRLTEELVARIVEGTWAPGDAIPTEADLCAEAGVGRSTVREAVRALIGYGLLEIRRGRGTFVCPTEEWSPFEPLVLAARARADGSTVETGRQLVEARRLVEAGVAELAAARATAEDHRALAAAVDAARRAEDLDRFVEADLAFHRALLDAAGNPFVVALFDPLDRLLRDERRRTSAQAESWRPAIDAHQAVLDAVLAGDGPAARAAMDRHLDRTALDVDRRR